MDKKRSYVSFPEQYLSSSGDCIITLDSPQYFFYQSHHIQVHAPNGAYLETIGHLIKSKEIRSGVTQLKEQIFLVECLLGNIIRDLRLPAQIDAALKDLLDRIQSVCEVS